MCSPPNARSANSGSGIHWSSGINRPPEFKIYFNPELKGVELAPSLVATALDRLGLNGSYRAVLDHGVRPGELGRADRLTFFALDLHDAPHARVKLYLSHHDAEPGDVARAAAVVDGVNAEEFAEFCVLAGGQTGTFSGRPLISSYTFLGELDRPAGYSVYVPIRSYVNDDEEAHEQGGGAAGPIRIRQLRAGPDHRSADESAAT